MTAMPETILREGDQHDGFRIQRVTPIPAQRMVAYQIEHPRSGARILHLHAEDDENLFSINFPTPPPDDTGLPHILEHAVLGGSRKYPVREPFFEMVKMSMATFINAMTGSDTTYYPVASTVKKDLFNLAEVYFDAAFYPLLTESIFRREGHHLAPVDPAEPTGALTIDGIVYSEMKGAFSNPESRLYRLATSQLCPETIYAWESGGDPDHIPDLTYAAFRQFYETYYHPSQALFFLYGDIDTLDYLAFLRDRLDAFEARPRSPAIARQPRWNAPREQQDSYPVGQDEALEGKTYMTIDWLVGDALDPVDVTRLHVLGLFLLGHEAAPLKKALIDSKLGHDLVCSGDDTTGLEAVFCLGLKGGEPDRVGPFVELVLATLEAVAGQPMERESVETAFRQAAFQYQEILSSHPLFLMDRVMEAWRHDGDPLAFLYMTEQLAACRMAYDRDPGLFNRFIRERLLDNPHRLTTVLAPDREWTARTEAAFAERMARARDGLSEAQRRNVAEEAARLEQESGVPNTPEALATLPQLSVQDLPAKPKHIATIAETLTNGASLLRNDVFANGVNYLILNLDLRGLPPELWPYLSSYADAVSKLGAAGMDYQQMARRLAATTGGLSCQTALRTHVEGQDHPSWGVRLSIKALDDQMEPALDAVRDLLFGVDPRDRARLRDVVVQSLAHCRTAMVYHGSQTAALHAARGFTRESDLLETISGLPHLRLATALEAQFEDDAESLMARIEAVRDFLLAGPRLTASFTGSDYAADRVRQALGAWLSDMRDDPVEAGIVGFQPFDAPRCEGLAGPIDVAHCAQALRAPHISSGLEPVLTLGAHMVSLDYMLSEIRFKGHAYGAWLQYDPFAGMMKLGSFRDPNALRSLRVFDGVLDHVRSLAWTQTDVDRAIISTAKNDEKPIRPGAATAQALDRHLIGMTAPWREQRAEQLRAATPATVKEPLLAVLETEMAKASVCVVSNRRTLEAIDQAMPECAFTIEEVMI